MANFESELQKLMAQFAPRGGFGIPNIGGLERQLSQQSDYGARSATMRDVLGLQRQGAGRSVSSAFSPGTRQFQSQKDLLSALMDLHVRHGQLAESQRQNLLQMFTPIAHERANRPSWLSTALGGILGIGSQIAIPGIGGKIFGNPLEQMFKQQSMNQNVWKQMWDNPSLFSGIGP